MFKYKKTALILIFTAISLSMEAQCAMCRAVLENEEGQMAAQGINDGIVYLMAIPYILVAGLGFLIYRKFYKVDTK